jgi:hypothetical protein
MSYYKHKVIFNKVISRIGSLKLFREWYSCSLVEAKNLTDNLPHILGPYKSNINTNNEDKWLDDNELEKLRLLIKSSFSKTGCVVEIDVFTEQVDTLDYDNSYLVENSFLSEAQKWYESLDDHSKKMIDILMRNSVPRA